MKLLKKLQGMPAAGKLLRGAKGALASNDARNVSKHFSRYFQPCIANAPAQKEQVLRLRHQVYCEELKLEEEQPSQLEVDGFDAHSIHCYVRHISSGSMAGTVRLITSASTDEQLPIEKFCLESITDPLYSPIAFPRESICEISRLAVPAHFRRRKQDRFQGAANGSINPETYSVTELRCFPYIAVCLYFSAAATAFHTNKEHAYVMMEPRLARALTLVGIKFHQIGPMIDYHGRRAPFYINEEILFGGMSPGHRKLFLEIKTSLIAAVNPGNEGAEVSAKDNHLLEPEILAR